MGETSTCCYCQRPFPSGRTKPYCMRDQCTAEARAEFASQHRLVLMPKQGFTFVRVDDSALRTAGRSSGRTV